MENFIFTFGGKMLFVSDVLGLLFEDDSGLDSGGEEGLSIYNYGGNSLDTTALREEEAHLDGFSNGKFVLDKVLCGLCLPHLIDGIQRSVA